MCQASYSLCLSEWQAERMGFPRDADQENVQPPLLLDPVVWLVDLWC